MRSLRARSRLSRARLSGDEGFTLLESVVALLVVAMVTTALAAAVISGVRASLISRENQQAADFMTRALEEARQMDFAALGHLSSDIPGGDARITTCGADKCVNVGVGSEKLYPVTGAAVTAHKKDVVSNGVTYSVGTYVTQVPGYSADELRRVTVYTTWSAFGKTHTRRTSSLVTAAQRGLPLPRYTFTTADTAESVNPGGRVTYTLRLLNQGAPDRWNLALSGPAASSPWALYQDVNVDGAYTSGTDTALTDTNGDGTIDTGRLDPTTDLPILVTWQTTVLDLPSTRDLVVTASSVGQPTAPGASAALTLTTAVTNGPATPTPAPTPTATPTATPTPPSGADCLWSPVVPVATRPNASYSVKTYALHNGTSGSIADSTAQSVSSMNLTGASAHPMAAMSTDVNALAGRTLNPVVAGTDAAALAVSDARQFGDWKVSTGASTVNIGGTAVLKMWVAPVSGSLANPSVRVVVYSGTTAVGGTAITVASTCTGWQLFYVSVPVTTTTVAKNSQYGVRVVNTGTSAVRIGYDAVVAGSATNGYQAALDLAVK